MEILQGYNGCVIDQSTTPLPLTYFGNAGIKQKPSMGSVKVEFIDNANPIKVKQLTSEIFE